MTDKEPKPRKVRSAAAVALGRRVRRLREHHGWRQKELAAVAHVPRSWLSRLELGDIDVPGAQRSDALARVFGVSPHYLLTGHSDDSGAEDSEFVSVSVPRRNLAWIQRVCDLPEDLHELALRLVDTLRTETTDQAADEQRSGQEPTGRAG